MCGYFDPSSIWSALLIYGHKWYNQEIRMVTLEGHIDSLLI
jgi:hypothetical protein